MKDLIRRLLHESLEDRLRGAFDKWCDKTWMDNKEWVEGVRDEYEYDIEGYETRSFDDYLNYELSRRCSNEMIIQVWMTYRKQMDKPDIFQYKTWKEFMGDLDRARKKSFTKQLKTASEGEDYEKIYEDNNMIIITPLTHVGSCKYGQGAKWCTASKDNPQYFTMYNNMGNLYRVLQKDGSDLSRFSDIFDRGVEYADKVSLHFNQIKNNITLTDRVDNAYNKEKAILFLQSLPESAYNSIIEYEKQNKRNT